MDNSNNMNTSDNATTNNPPLSIDLSKIDPNTKVYIDEACRASSNEIINTLKAYIAQSTATQMDLIRKLNERLDAGKTIAIRKRNHTTRFTDIAEWLLVFKAYVEAILIIYESREQELST
ncbi:hypothetical protein C2G38_2042541 [Gigaspora rosea]|uniref:Uncharacterized protein n=1 Tax=Gigaspora rosea TaxID=44941 RepID=A0A397UMY8_9GLOM|nr:hypothetical protein C2G38_2042541 [Gigaspora rosea]